ncbi:MAG: hypothetical protein OXG07_08810 [Anaerolineaceae bacterium]|nr:hypothetical protein [Anaerolineaceae bacterium]MCY3907949.1 hypothetical protein [Anaerolineaceae bacterium]
MALDYVIDHNCAPKQALTTAGILERLKARERAATIIRLYRRSGDQRSPREMGFEMLRTAADGSEETQIVVVQHLLDSAAELDSLAPHCEGCPANRTGAPFGCMGRIDYPISPRGEAFLLDSLPDPPTAPLVWLLLKQGIRDFNYDGGTVRPLRAEDRNIFVAEYALRRDLGELPVDSDQVFEMTFLTGHVRPNHAAILLLFFDALAREELEAMQITELGALPPEERAAFDFLIPARDARDDDSTADMRAFLHALYLAWRLDVPLLLDV